MKQIVQLSSTKDTKKQTWSAPIMCACSGILFYFGLYTAPNDEVPRVCEREAKKSPYKTTVLVQKLLSNSLPVCLGQSRLRDRNFHFESRDFGKSRVQLKKRTRLRYELV